MPTRASGRGLRGRRAGRRRCGSAACARRPRPGRADRRSTTSSSASASPTVATTSSPASTSRRVRPGPEEHGVLGDDDPHGSSTRRVVGPPAGLITSQRATEAGRPGRGGRRRPVPRSGSAPPTPSSRTSTVRRSPARTRSTAGLGGLGVAGDVGQRLGHDVVGRALDRGRGRSAHVDVDGRRAPGSGRRRPTGRRRGPGPRGCAGGCPGRGRAARRGRPWPPRGRCRAGPGRASGSRSRRSRAAPRSMASATSRCWAPSCRSRSMRRRSRLGGVDGGDPAGLDRPHLAVEGVTLGGTEQRRAAARSRRARATVTRGRHDHEADQADEGEAEGAEARAELEQPELGRAAGSAADVERQGEEHGRAAPETAGGGEAEQAEREGQERVADLPPAGPAGHPLLEVGPPVAGGQRGHRVGDQLAQQDGLAGALQAGEAPGPRRTAARRRAGPAGR